MGGNTPWCAAKTVLAIPLGTPCMDSWVTERPVGDSLFGCIVPSPKPWCFLQVSL